MSQENEEMTDDQGNLFELLSVKNGENIEIDGSKRPCATSVFNSTNVCRGCSELVKKLDEITYDLGICKNLCAKLQERKRKHDDDLGDSSKMGVKTSSSEVSTSSQLEEELKQFYEYCKENHLSDEEIANICKPLSSPTRLLDFKLFRYLAIFFAVTAVLYFLTYFETVQWHYSAISRIFLIELLSYWDWKEIKTEKCIVKRPIEEIPPPLDQECTFCEYIRHIDVVDAHLTEVIYQKYLRIHKPVLLENGLQNWMDPLTADDFLDMILKDEVLSRSFPCKFKSNAFYGSRNLYQSLKNLRDNDVYFAHFQNCESVAVKAFRKYVRRPKFLAAEILPIKYSWVVVTNNYDVEKYKHITLSDQITIVGQFQGKMDVVLHPNECLGDCQSLKISLVAGEVLLFSAMWSMEYKADGTGQNLAIILETRS